MWKSLIFLITSINFIVNVSGQPLRVNYVCNPPCAWPKRCLGVSCPSEPCRGVCLPLFVDSEEREFDKDKDRLFVPNGSRKD
ncbi:hypothetical protein QR680_006203 [Steinernema hermaphroditum]|uniref:WAP domain-containing protein n=1 Tax=Steinernema hermaphroditum TaxID=289476 RepID=A0AA39LW55_9BILA|nr:hypothetical protein QR680_006203 [Steinernema hermaphroditum]